MSAVNVFETGRVKTRAYDSARYLDTPETIAAYLTEARETKDSSFIASAFETVARARRMHLEKGMD